MIINEHLLIHADDAGNGYHGNCKHCGVALVTDLGYCSWDGVRCIDREVDSYNDIPDEIKRYANWHALKWNKDEKKYFKTYSTEEYTIDQLSTIIKKIKQHNDTK